MSYTEVHRGPQRTTEIFFFQLCASLCFLCATLCKFLLFLCVLCCPFACFAVNSSPDTIRIGLLVQDKKSVAAKHGAELAISEANRTSKNGKYYSLQVRNMEGPWGTGAKESVSLVFDEDVRAVIGAVDGRNSHLAEQVSAKTGVPYISALSGDPSLGQAFIPWFFSCVPNDNQVAALISRDIEKKTFGNIVIVSAEDYDCRMASASMQKELNSGKLKKAEIIYYKNSRKISDLTRIIADAGALIFFGPPLELGIILESVKKLSPITVYVPYFLLHETVPGDLKQFEGAIMLNPGNFFNNGQNPFTNSFFRIYGSNPGALQAYAYDAVNVIIKGISLSGHDGQSLFRNIAKINLQGATGEISFDEKGSRKALPGLIRIEKGGFVPIED